MKGDTLATLPLPNTSALPADWARVIGGFEPNLDSIYTAGTNVFPDRARVFQAFWGTPLSKVRVILLGQDPYDTAGLADGLAFSQSGPTSKQSALHRLFLNLERDPEIEFSRPATGDLTRWADQGVLLLNAALTVLEDNPKSHLSQWKNFVKRVLHHFNSSHAKVAFILLGRDAIRLALPELNQVDPAALIRAAHPMAGDPGKERPFHTARVFSEANVFLGPDHAVDWCLA